MVEKINERALPAEVNMYPHFSQTLEYANKCIVPFWDYANYSHVVGFNFWGDVKDISLRSLGDGHLIFNKLRKIFIAEDIDSYVIFAPTKRFTKNRNVFNPLMYLPLSYALRDNLKGHDVLSYFEVSHSHCLVSAYSVECELNTPKIGHTICSKELIPLPKEFILLPLQTGVDEIEMAREEVKQYLDYPESSSDEYTL